MIEVKNRRGSHGCGLPRTFQFARIVALACIIAGCSVDGSYMKATIDGKKWNLANEPEPIGFRAEFDEMTNKLSIEGWSQNARDISEILIRIENPRKEIFLLNEDSYNHAQIWKVEGSKKETYLTNADGCSGKVTISRFTNSYVAGRFSFTARDEFGNPIKVTNGRFGMPLDLLDF